MCTCRAWTAGSSRMAGLHDPTAHEYNRDITLIWLVPPKGKAARPAGRKE